MSAHVLVIEDDPDIRRDMVALLEGETGMEALEILEEGAEPCLALLDIMMPVMNGLEFLDALRDRGLAPMMHVVLVSAYVQIAKQVAHPRVTELLPKPFRAADLLAVVRRHCPQPPGADSAPAT